MDIGFLTGSLGGVPLEQLVPWAAQNGFASLEISTWPKSAMGGKLPRHIDADAFTADDAARVNDLLDEHGVRISAFAYFDNILHGRKEKTAEHRRYLRNVIDAAALLGVDRVGTFVGGRPVNPDRNMKEIGVIFREVVAYAEDQGVRVMIENCPMFNWVQFGIPGNYAFSPELWDALFTEVPSDSFGLNLDPSHLLWLGIDYLRATREYGSKVFHAHAKDVEMLPEGRYRYGSTWKQLDADTWRSGWWRYKVPGDGEVDWAAFVAALREVGYDDVLSIEHEDDDFEGEAGVKAGLLKARQHLESAV
ncbi:sugar phosphate isomerase/epimerase family protein [Rubrivirga sp.]|uniref:sugar phosphate isomerase/epimerase family protein n=1 Tax=Rubrivirga sp. TaxID=1885344 RepID=UPI003B51E283